MIKVIILAGTVRVPEERRDAIAAQLPDLVAHSQREPGVLAYTLSWDPTDDTLLHVYEIYRDGAALDAHRQSPHYRVWRSATEGFVRDLHTWDATPRIKN
ncbi:MAG: antibiotic biosynthesis monooxygenase [Alphaproteobacteria bacterium]|nr:antibiotic biosynthesis monooxygenase [Alphaproteobacteria bacterium]